MTHALVRGCGYPGNIGNNREVVDFASSSSRFPPTSPISHDDLCLGILLELLQHIHKCLANHGIAAYSNNRALANTGSVSSSTTS